MSGAQVARAPGGPALPTIQPPVLLGPSYPPLAGILGAVLTAKAD
jgi:hypothetical protein